MRHVVSVQALPPVWPGLGFCCGGGAVPTHSPEWGPGPSVPPEVGGSWPPEGSGPGRVLATRSLNSCRPRDLRAGPCPPAPCELVTDLSPVFASLSCSVPRGQAWLCNGVVGDRPPPCCALRAGEALQEQLLRVYPGVCPAGVWQACSAPCAQRTRSCPVCITVWRGHRMCVNSHKRAFPERRLHRWEEGLWE